MMVVFAGGGTGGHVMPALAVAQALERRDEKVRIAFIGTAQGMEAKQISGAGYVFCAVRAAQVRGVGLIRGLSGLVKTALGLLEARRHLKTLGADVVVCLGGYAGFAAGLAAKQPRRPLVVLEANAFPGRANRLLARLADLVVIPFEEARGRIAGRRVETLGNPVRPKLLEDFSKRKRAGDDGVFRLFVCGGSQGSRRLNQATEAYALSLGEELGRGVRIRHQTGGRDFERVREFYRSRNLPVEPEAFIEDMAGAYAEADLVLGRAGGQVAELAALGMPGILVPYPFAADDHQRANAAIFERAGAAVVIEDDKLNGDSLAEALGALRASPERLRAMSKAARSLGRPQAAFEIAGRVLELGGGG